MSLAVHPVAAKFRSDGMCTLLSFKPFARKGLVYLGIYCIRVCFSDAYQVNHVEFIRFWMILLMPTVINVWSQSSVLVTNDNDSPRISICFSSEPSELDNKDSSITPSVAKYIVARDFYNLLLYFEYVTLAV